MPQTESGSLSQVEQLRRTVGKLEEELRRARAAADGDAAFQDRGLLEAENADLRDRVRRLQRLAMMGTLSSMVAHEFNNILTPVISYAQLAQTNPDLVGKALERAAEGGERATQICSAMLGLTRPQMQEETVFVKLLVEETLEAIGRSVQKDAIALALEIPDELSLRTRRVEFQQVLMNLVLNARRSVLKQKAMRRLRIAAGREADIVTLSVSDTGEGIHPDHIDRIFEPFFTTAEFQDGKPQGSGLGLTICREIIQDLGGRIEVASEWGRGATFTVALPAGEVPCQMPRG